MKVEIVESTIIPMELQNFPLLPPTVRFSPPRSRTPFDSWQSGDSRKYWWIHDNTYDLPPGWEGQQSDPDALAPAEEQPEMLAESSTQANQRVLELEALTRDLTEEVSSLRASNNGLVQRVADLTVYICTKWVDQSASTATRTPVNLRLLVPVSLISMLVGMLLVYVSQ